jgi:tRNA dimethylallyltransferase
MEEFEVIIIYGPTASGKTLKAVELADACHGEIVSVDSVQIYREMDIGTAKPDKSLRQKYPHHMIDILNPDESLNAQDFSELAMTAMRDIASRGKLPLLAGGTGLYFKAILEGLFQGPGRDNRIRERLQRMAEEQGRTALHDYLKRIDPESARTIHPNNLHRIVRAIEVYELTGHPISELKKEQKRKVRLKVRQEYFMNPPREVLYRNIDVRTDWMFEHGLMEEVEKLIKRYSSTLMALNTIGYKEAIACLLGCFSVAEAKEQVKQATRNYAKRQVTWFSRQMKRS